MTDMTKGAPFPGEMMQAMGDAVQKSGMSTAMASQVERFWQTQNQILEGYEDLIQRWYKRRHEAVQTAQAMAHELGQQQDMAQGYKALSDWFTASMGRISEDTKDHYEFYLRCLGNLQKSFDPEQIQQAAPAKPAAPAAKAVPAQAEPASNAAKKAAAA